jgi:hypothetical protein
VATKIQVSAEATDVSQSLASRRHHPGHAKVRSMTQRRGRAPRRVRVITRRADAVMVFRNWRRG